MSKLSRSEKRNPRYMELYREALETITTHHDKREAYFMQLIAFAATHKYEEIPEVHRERLDVARVSVPWRADKKVVALMKKSARMYARTELKKEQERG